MLLNPYLFKDNNDNKFISNESLKKAGIVYRKRKIYIMKRYAQKCFDARSIFNSYLMNNVILINISRTKTEEGIYRNIKSTYSFVYTGVKGESISEFLNARLRLQYCITSGYECDETFKEGEYENSNYYEDLGFTFGFEENDDPVEVNINDMYCDESVIPDNSEKLTIPDPRYYTESQYFKDGNVDDTFIMRRDRFYDARDLIDEVADVFLVKEDEQENFNTTQCLDSNNELIPNNNAEAIFENWEKIKDAQELPFDMFILNSQSCFSSYKFIYDTKTGFNMKNVMTNKSIIRNRNSDYISMISKRMRKIGDKLSKYYGNIRIYYYSSDISDKVEIIFDDDNHKKISSTFDKNSMFERLMVFMSDKYKNYIERPLINYDNLSFLSLA